MMNPVGFAELAQIQADLAKAVCNLPCTVQRATTKTPDGMGSNQPSYTTVSLPGLLAGMSQPSQQLLQNYSYRIESLNSWLVKLPWGTLMSDGSSIQSQDHLVIGGYTLVAHIPLDPRSYPGLEIWLAAVLKP